LQFSELARWILTMLNIKGTICLLFIAAWAPLSPAEEEVPYLAWGKQLFFRHCAVCHGVGGIGHGPAAPLLKTAPTDLTQIAKRNGGKFPRLEVVRYIDGERPVAAHGSSEMPIWGRVFRAQRSGSAGASPEIYALTDYIKSIQK
jgi:mono/diheme cytochrome c family protein